MKSALILAVLIPGFAMAAQSYECTPDTKNNSIAKVVIIEKDGPGAEMELWAPDGLISKTAAEYYGDVDYVSYYSEEADANISIHWGQMQEKGEADGIIEVGSDAKRQVFDAFCKSTSL